jgi:hypothetical protein
VGKEALQGLTSSGFRALLSGRKSIDGYLGVGSRFPDTGGETPGRFSRAEGTLERVRCDDDAHRIPERAAFIRIPSRRS